MKLDKWDLFFVASIAMAIAVGVAAIAMAAIIASAIP